MRRRDAVLGLVLASCALASGCGGGGATNEVSGGAFMMGCNSMIDKDCDSQGREEPAHMVTLKSFSIDAHEVTWNEYSDCVQQRKCSDPAGDNSAAAGDTPVVSVTWDQATAYCKAQGKHLPTEAQWEYAARGKDGRVFPWGADKPDCNHAVTYECMDMAAQSATGASAGASPFGAVNMAGNVREWVADFYGAYPRGAQDDPTGPSSGNERVNRGGSFRLAAKLARTSARWSDAPFNAEADLGFRCAN